MWGHDLPDTSDGFAELSDQLAEALSATPPRPAQRPGVALGKVLDALHALRNESAPARVIDSAAHEICAAGVFDRVMFSLVQGSTWLPQTTYVYEPSGQVQPEFDVDIAGIAIPLASPLLEAEVVRRRLPALVNNAHAESRLHRPLVRRTGTAEYVVAPVVAESAVIGLLHADTAAGGRSLTSIDRDLLRIFADGVGVIYERARLAERIEQQRVAVAQVCEAAAHALQEMDASPLVSFAGPDVRAAQVVERERTADPRVSGRLARLTAREREVLALLASGATNSQLADRLTVAESTVKSHVKHILHKLDARNRAGAIACYMRETTGVERRSR